MEKFLSLLNNTGRATVLSFKYLPRLTLGILVVTVLSSIAPLFQAKILGDIVNEISSTASQSSAIFSLMILVLLYVSIWMMIRFSGVLELYLMKLWRDGAMHTFELLIFKKRTEIDLGHYEDPKFQTLLLRAFSQGTAGPMIDVITNQFVIISSIAVIIVSSFIATSIGWNIYLIVIVCSIPSFFVQTKYGHKVWGIWAEHSERQKKYSAMRSHILSRTGITQIRLLQNKDRVLEIIRDVLESFRKENNRLDTQRFIYQTGAAVISAIGFGISLWLIVVKVITGVISVGTLIFIVSALGALIGSFNILLARIATQVEKNLYLNDIFTVLDTKPFIKRSEHPVKLDLKSPPLIQFEKVSFKYDGRDDWILKDVDLVLHPGEKVALVGMNGAGKSSLIKLLSRIYDPTEGRILVNGVDLKDVDPEEWNSYLSVLLQDYMTYELPTKESIAMSRTDKPLNEELVKASSVFSGANEFIEEWEHSYDQQLGKNFEGGIEPSRGQHQKIALARTLYRNASIVVLDEPTAAIDSLSETRIFEAMENAVGPNTLIVITHRFNTTQSLDKIIVLDHGKVIENGSHTELLEKNGLYKEMFESQAKAFRSEISELELPSEDKPKRRTRKKTDQSQ